MSASDSSMPSEEEEQGQQHDVMEDPAHRLLEPALVKLRTALDAQEIASATVDVASPFPPDMRQHPGADTLLDLAIAGSGTTQACRTSRLEFATASQFYTASASFGQLPTQLTVEIGHAGVVLLLEALYAKKVQLDKVSAVDLLQAAAYFQVACALNAAVSYLWTRTGFHCLPLLYELACDLGLQSWQDQMLQHLVTKFFEFDKRAVAGFLALLPAGERETLLRRDDLCAPLEFAVVQVLAELSLSYPLVDITPLLDCVRWQVMTADELAATATHLSQHTQLTGAFAYRLFGALHAIHEGMARLVESQPRQAQLRCAQLLVDASEIDPTKRIKSDSYMAGGGGVEDVSLLVTSVGGSSRLECWVHPTAVGGMLPPALTCVFLAITHDGLHSCKRTTAKRQRHVCKPGFLNQLLGTPLTRLHPPHIPFVFLAAYIPQLRESPRPL